MAGRKPKPVEIHKRTGTYRKDRHGGNLALVEAIDKSPYELTAADAFEAIMTDGVGWLARTDAPALALLRSMLEEREGLRDLAFQGSNESRKALRDLDKQIISLLSNLGFDPAARARLGLAEVKTKSVLEQLREKRT